MRGWGRLVFVCFAFLFSPTIACLAEDGDTKLTPTEAETLFLDRLMRAESGGRQYARNRASSALGPFQFLGTTFLDVVRRNFPALASGKTDADLLALRTDFQVSRDVALIYTRENASAIAAKGKETTAANLRLAFFAGANGALQSPGSRAGRVGVQPLESGCDRSQPISEKHDGEPTSRKSKPRGGGTGRRRGRHRATSKVIRRFVENRGALQSWAGKLPPLACLGGKASCRQRAARLVGAED